MQATERFDIALNTPAGRLTTAVEVTTERVPVTAIVPLARRLGEDAQALEQARARENGKELSCQKGCAACCRMMVPLSPPEAFALRDYLHALPPDRRRRIADRFAETKTTLLSRGLWQRLAELGEQAQSPNDDALEPLNRAYYALRMPCPFLEDECCSIYEARPAACRELLVTSPAEWCQDLVHNPVASLPVPIRVGPALSLLWSELTQSPARLIPLPTAIEWAERHESENRTAWPGTELLDRTLDKVWRFLSQAFQTGQEANGERRAATGDTPVSASRP